MKRFRNILFVNDPETKGAAAFERAVTLAEADNAHLTIVEVVEPIPSFVIKHTPYRLRQLTIRHRKAGLKDMCASVGGRIRIDAKILEGKFIMEVVSDVLRSGRDLVIKPAEGRGGVLSGLFGSKDMQLLRMCPCPVWLIKSGQKRPTRRIMAAVDFDEPGEDRIMGGLNRQILELAYSQAQTESSSLDIVHVWDAVLESYLKATRTGASTKEIRRYVKSVRDESRAQLKQLIADAQTWLGPDEMKSVEMRSHLVRGRPRIALARQAQKLKADLLVMGTVARTGVPGFFMGNTAESVLEQIRCSVLAVKPPGFVTPITPGN